MQRLLFDIEANDLPDKVTDVWCIATIDVDTGLEEAYGPDELDEGLEALQQADVLLGHNLLTYDLPVIEKVCNVSLDPRKVIDTLVLSRLGNPERAGGHSLDSWGQRLKFNKIDFDQYDRYTPEMLEYCKRDAKLNYHVWKRLEKMYEVMPKAVEIEMEVARIVYDMQKRGLHFDEAGAVDLLNNLMTERERLEEEVVSLMPHVYKPKGKPKSLKHPPNSKHWGHGAIEPGAEYQELTHVPLRIGSRQDIARYFIDKYGWKPTRLTATEQPVVNDEVLRGLPWPEAEVMADYFKADKLIGYLSSEPKENGTGGGWIHHARDGIIRAQYIPLQAVTGRPSCRAPNLQQVSSDARARRLFSAGPGRKLVGVDADGQELRCLGHYLYTYDNGAYAKEVVEGDIHSRVQEVIGFETRNGTKPVEYGLIYGAGDEKLGLISLKDKMSVGKKVKGPLRREGARIRKAIMEGIPGFEELLTAVKTKAKTNGRLRGLDGRTLWVRSPHSALNLLLQSAGAIHMKATMVMADERLRLELLEDEDYGLVHWVHDELQYWAMPEVGLRHIEEEEMRTAVLDADVIVHKACQHTEGTEDVEWGEFTEEQGLDKCVEIATDMAWDWSRTAGCNECVLAFSGRSEANFRKAVMTQYKAHRTQPKPEYYHETRQALMDKFTYEVAERLEGDDIMGLLLTGGDVDVAVSTDKDVYTLPGQVLRIPFNEYDPHVVKAITPLEADRYFMRQVLTGDSSDGYKGAPGIGKVKAERALEECTSVEEMWKVVVRLYTEQYWHPKWGPKAQFPNLAPQTAALMNARCAFILRHGSYNWTTEEVKLWTP
jgi:DNA polymerase-1